MLFANELDRMSASYDLINLDDSLIDEFDFISTGTNRSYGDLFQSNWFLSARGRIVIINQKALELAQRHSNGVTIENYILPWQDLGRLRVAVATPEQLRSRFGIISSGKLDLLVTAQHPKYLAAQGGHSDQRIVMPVQIDPPPPDLEVGPLTDAIPALPAVGQHPPAALYTIPGDPVEAGDPALPAYVAVNDGYGGAAVPLSASASISVPLYDVSGPEVLTPLLASSLYERRHNLSSISEHAAVDLGEFSYQPRAIQEQVVQPLGWGASIVGGLAAAAALFPVIRRAYTEWSSRPIVAVSDSREVPPPFDRRNAQFNVARALIEAREGTAPDPTVPADPRIDASIKRNIEGALAPLTAEEMDEIVDFHKANKSRVVVMSPASTADKAGISGAGGGGVALAAIAAAALFLLNK